MKLALAFVAAGCLALSSGAQAATKVLHVDCAAEAGGDGSGRAPFRRITDALPAARALAAAHEVTIAVEPGTCSAETFPLVLDFPVWLRGSRAPIADAEGLPTGAQDADTLITRAPPGPAFFLRITGMGVRVSHLSLDGQVANVVPPATGTSAIDVAGAQGFAVHDVRITRVISGIRTSAASGEVVANHLSAVSSAVAILGGTATSPASVRVAGNRIDDHVTGGIALVASGPAGNVISAVVTGNDLFTTRTNTGPSNPYGFRVNSSFTTTTFPQGHVEATIAGNRIRGTHRMPVIVNGATAYRTIQNVPDPAPYSATFDLDFRGNVIEPGANTLAPAVITFTHSRIAERPCELSPSCPTLTNGQSYKYLQGSVYVLRHGGELDGALIDHPATDPIDGRVLHNALNVNGAEVPNQTFLQLP